MKPIGNYLFVKPFPEREFSLGGVYIPEQYREKSFWGTAAFVSISKNPRREINILPGEKVLYSGEQEDEGIYWEGETYLRIKRSNILAKIKEESEFPFVSGQNRVIVKVEPEEKKYNCKIDLVIPDEYQVTGIWGEVVSVGPGVKVDVLPEDKILFNRYQGFVLEYEGQEYKICDEADLYFRLARSE